MNPTVILGVILSAVILAGGSYIKGRGDGYELQQVEQRRIELEQHQAREEALSAAASEIAKIDVKQITIQGKVIERIRTEQVYTECKHSPETFNMIKEAFSE